MTSLPKPHLSLPTGAGTITDLAFSPDGKKLAAVTSRGFLHVWYTNTGNHVFHQRLSRSRLLTVAWNRAGRHLSIGGEDGALYRVTSLTNPRITAHFFPAAIRQIAWSHSPLGRCLVVADSTLTILDERGFPPIMLKYATPILDAAWAADGHTLALVCEDGLVEIMDARDVTASCTIKDLSDPRCLSWHRDGRLAIGTASGHVQLTDQRVNIAGESLSLSRFPIQALCWGEHHLVASSEGADDLTIWSQTGQMRQQPFPCASPSFTFHPQGTVLATGLSSHVSLASL